MKYAEAQELKTWLEHSHLVTDCGVTIENAADTYDDMNGNDDFQTALSVIRAWEPTLRSAKAFDSAQKSLDKVNN